MSQNIQKLSASQLDGHFVRMDRIKGYLDRCNDIILIHKSMCSSCEKMVFFFGGDLQDFEQNMIACKEWSLEKVALLLAKKFPTENIVVVRPSRYENTFSCFDNFVPTGKYGIPKFVDYHHSLIHLQKLRNQICSYIYGEDEMLNGIKIIGFSKGCVVLNQFIRELHSLRTGKVTNMDCNILSLVEDVYFLDGGHAGGKDTWITNDQILQSLTASGIRIHIHVTPYQVHDVKRPWIAKEEEIFYNTLVKLNADIHRTLHFKDELPCLNKHFQVLNEFT